ncbi:hypothetical protein ACXH4D_005549, partial [Klebsiella variicola]
RRPESNSDGKPGETSNKPPTNLPETQEMNFTSLHINTQKCLGSNFNTFASPPPCFCNFSH